MSDRAGTVLVYLKYPEPGRVKTRLAATVGADAAAGLYRGWIGLVLERLQSFRPSVSIVGAIDGAAPEAFAEWGALVDSWWQQPPGDLGCRLDAGFQFAHRSGGPVLAIGTDCLEIEPAAIREALAVLRDVDAVFGPTHDGGYYLVGTAEYLAGFFDGIRWSSSDTLGDHILRCGERNWRAELLPVLNDIDTWDDWGAYCRRVGVEIGSRAVSETATQS